MILSYCIGIHVTVKINKMLLMLEMIIIGTALTLYYRYPYHYDIIWLYSINL